MTWTETRSETISAAAPPASVAALTAPTSPSTKTAVRPPPTFDMFTNRTLAAFSAASRASMAPMRPTTSIMPSACFVVFSFIRSHILSLQSFQHDAVPVKQIVRQRRDHGPLVHDHCFRAGRDRIPHLDFR